VWLGYSFRKRGIRQNMHKTQDCWSLT